MAAIVAATVFPLGRRPPTGQTYDRLLRIRPCIFNIVVGSKRTILIWLRTGFGPLIYRPTHLITIISSAPTIAKHLSHQQYSVCWIQMRSWRWRGGENIVMSVFLLVWGELWAWVFRSGSGVNRVMVNSVFMIFPVAARYRAPLNKNPESYVNILSSGKASK